MLNTVQGYEVDLLAQPYQCLPPKELSFSREETNTLSEEVEKMLTKSAISLVQGQSPGFHSQLFVVPRKDGGQRPIINLKKLNSFVKPQHFKMESITMLKDILKKGDYMTKVDLKDAYFMVPMSKKHKLTPNEIRLGRENLPIQLPSFQVVFGPMDLYQDRKATRGCPEIDGSQDDHVHRRYTHHGRVRDSSQGTHSWIDTPPRESENLGFVINHLKSPLTPSQETEFLGFIINSNTMGLKLPGEKIKKIRAETRRLANQTEPKALVLSRLLGKLNHATQAIPPAPLFYRNLQSCLRIALEEGNQDSTDSRGYGGTPMVGVPPNQLEWAEPNPTSHDDDHRMLQP